MRTDSWADYYLGLCDYVATKSKDTTKVGAVAVSPDNHVLGTAYNGIPMGVEDDPEKYPERYEKPTKYTYTMHAEANIVALAAKHGVRLKGAELYVNLHPCAECVRLLIQAGIKKIHCVPDEGSGAWRETLDEARQMLEEAGVELQTYIRKEK